jgi:hypothetical protein
MTNYKDYLENGYSYDEYWAFFENLVNEKKSNWHEQTQEMIDYTKLNYQRARRIHKQFQPLEKLVNFINKLDSEITFLAITEPWCGDAAQNLPIFHELSKESDKITFKLALRDQNPDLMDLFLTNGARSIPKVIILNQDLELQAVWGPRPKHAQEMVMDFKKNPWTEQKKFYEEVQTWYNNDHGQSLQNEILEILKTRK